ncbi:MAG: orotidine-5'-phosphate decarboxylase [Defluviitaleaceae bacterium]|nr:orotidine-5'-phosphate decarboxylase [Defluviitaleaceae bacterium]
MTDRLIELIKLKKNPTVVGLDPKLEFIPNYLLNEAKQKHEDIYCAAADAIFKFNCCLIDKLHDIIPAVKPQIAFYEQYGAPGIEAYINTLRYVKSKGLITIGDVKRGDIASTAEAYADAHLGFVLGAPVFDSDFATINPYLGFDSVSPFINACKKYDKGIFVLVKTSNPGAGDLQDINTDEGKVYEIVGRKVCEWGADSIGKNGYSRVCAVAGATYPHQIKKLRNEMPSTFFLVPGYGAQGGTSADVKQAFDAKGSGALINNSRGIIAAYLLPQYKKKYNEKEFADAAREAAVAMRDDIADGINA